MMRSARLPRAQPLCSPQGIDFSDSATVVARKLIGMTLLVHGVGGVIVETEAYDQKESAAHSFVGQTPRNASLFGPPGRAYVYLSYGVHWCLNVVCAEAGHGAGVLIRALEPTHGINRMIERRRCSKLERLCSGPGRLGQALAISRALDGRRIDERPFTLAAANDRARIVRGPRIGITKSTELRWRFGLAGSRYLSRPFD